MRYNPKNAQEPPSPANAVRGNFFFFFFGWGAWLPFLAPYLKNNCGFGERNVGILLAISPALAFVALPFWSWVADRAGRPARVAWPLTFASALIFPLAAFTGTFWVVALIFVVHALFATPLISLGDSIAFSALGEANRARYSSWRLWGSVGFTVSAACCGVLFDIIGDRWLFGVFALSMIAAAVCVVRIDRMDYKRNAPERIHLGELYSNRPVLVFVFVMFLAFFSTHMVLAFIGIYAIELGGTTAGVGWLWAVSAGLEILVMLFAGRLISRFGVRNLIILGMSAALGRTLLLAVATHWIHVVACMTLNCLFFLGGYVGGITLIDTLTPRRLRASGQGLFGLAVMNGALMAATLTAGYVVESIGYRGLFLSAAALAAISLILFVVLIHPPEQKYPK